MTQVYYEEDFKFMTTINEDEQEEEDDLLSRMSERSEQVLNRSGFLDRKVRV